MISSPAHQLSQELTHCWLFFLSQSQLITRPCQLLKHCSSHSPLFGFPLPHLRPSSPCVLSSSFSASVSSSAPHSSCPKHGRPRPSQMDIRVCGFLAHKTPKSLYATDKAHISESGIKNLPRLGLSFIICPLACHETYY